jgi:hypothetical protein
MYVSLYARNIVGQIAASTPGISKSFGITIKRSYTIPDIK